MKNELCKDTHTIPEIDDRDLFEKRRDKAWEQDLEACPCCGKALKDPKYFINSIYGGEYYPADDLNEYDDSWVMPVGTECRKLFPPGYVFRWKKESGGERVIL